MHLACCRHASISVVHNIVTVRLTTTAMLVALLLLATTNKFVATLSHVDVLRIWESLPTTRANIRRSSASSVHVATRNCHLLHRSSRRAVAVHRAAHLAHPARALLTRAHS